jgi:hypothetical protein
MSQSVQSVAVYLDCRFWSLMSLCGQPHIPRVCLDSLFRSLEVFSYLILDEANARNKTAFYEKPHRTIFRPVIRKEYTFVFM